MMEPIDKNKRILLKYEQRTHLLSWRQLRSSCLGDKYKILKVKTLWQREDPQLAELWFTSLDPAGVFSKFAATPPKNHEKERRLLKDAVLRGKVLSNPIDVAPRRDHRTDKVWTPELLANLSGLEIGRLFSCRRKELRGRLRLPEGIVTLESLVDNTDRKESIKNLIRKFYHANQY